MTDLKTLDNLDKSQIKNINIDFTEYLCCILFDDSEKTPFATIEFTKKCKYDPLKNIVTFDDKSILKLNRKLTNKFKVFKCDDLDNNWEVRYFALFNNEYAMNTEIDIFKQNMLKAISKIK